MSSLQEMSRQPYSIFPPKYFLQSTNYGAGESKRYVSYKTHKEGHVRYYELLGPLYGQRDGSRRWFETIASWLVDKDQVESALAKAEAEEAARRIKEATKVALGFGLGQGKNEPCLFRDPSTGFTVILYVDDVLTRGSREQTELFHKALGERFDCKDESYLSEDNDLDFIGFTISQEGDGDTKSFYTDQESAMQLLLDSFDRGALQLKDVPMPSKHLLHSDATLLSDNEASIYRHFIGTLNYFSRATRFDIFLAVSRLSSKMSCPDAGSWKALVHLLGYLVRTVDFRIGGEVQDDSDHAGDRQMNSRSQTGYLLFLNSFPVDWCSRKQPNTSVSPAQADIYMQCMRQLLPAG